MGERDSRRNTLRRWVLAVFCAAGLGGLVAGVAVRYSTASPGTAGSMPFVAGMTTVSLPYGPVDVWYPADPVASRGKPRVRFDLRQWLPPALAARVASDPAAFTTSAYRNIAPAAGRSYPLVLFAHGLYSFRDQSTFLTTWLASQGYVVAAPELPAHDLTEFFASQAPGSAALPSDYLVLVDTEQLMFRLDATPGSILHGLVRRHRVAAVGHSLGGLDAVQFATRPEVVTYVAMAAGWRRPPPDLPAKRSLFLTGTADHDVDPAWVRSTYRAAPAPKRLVVLPRAGHLAFTDLCLIDRNSGGLGAFGTHLGVTLGQGAPFTPAALDGCGPPDLSIAQGHRLIEVAVGQDLREAFARS